MYAGVVFIGGKYADLGNDAVIEQPTAEDSTFLAEQLSGRRARKQMADQIADLKQHFILCGFGRVGTTVARELERALAPRLALLEGEARGLEAGTLPPFLGTRIKTFSEELRDRSIRTLDLFVSRLAEKTNRKLPSPFYVTLPKVVNPEQVQALAAQPAVAGLFLHDIKGIDDLVDSISIANSDDVHALGYKGSGVKVAVWENAPDNTTNLSITARYKSNPSTSQHSRHTHGIIKNVEPNKPHGHAPDCNLHSANSYDLAAIRWAAQDRGCTVISQSFHRDAEETSSGLSYDDVYKDWLALRWPYPTICEAAGNGPDDEYVNHKGYNRLTVANHNDSASGMAATTCFRNPSSAHGDRELPEIVASNTFFPCQ